MKILMLLENEYLKDSRVKKEVHTLYRAGHEVVVATSVSTDLPSEEKRAECILLRKKIPPLTLKASVAALKAPVYFNFWRRYVRDILNKYTIDAIHVHDLPLGRIGSEIKKKYNKKLVIDLHENWPALLTVSSHTNTFLGRILSSEKQWRKYEKSCALSADSIITVVDEMKTRISKTGIDPAKIFVLENTPEVSSITQLAFERDEKFLTLAYVGGVSFHRGLQYVISGVYNLNAEIPVRLWIAGSGRYVDNLKDQVKNLNLENNVKFFGVLSKPEIDDMLKKSDFGLIPHIRSEQSDNSSPNKLFDYMAAGLPVLASNCISVKRIIDDTEAGETYIFDSSSDFTNVLRRLYNDPDRSIIFSEKGKKAVRERYNWEKSSESLIRLYSDLKLPK